MTEVSDPKGIRLADSPPSDGEVISMPEAQARLRGDTLSGSVCALLDRKWSQHLSEIGFSEDEVSNLAGLITMFMIHKNKNLASAVDYESVMLTADTIVEHLLQVRRTIESMTGSKGEADQFISRNRAKIFDVLLARGELPPDNGESLRRLLI